TRYALFLLTCAVLVAAGTKWTRKDPIAIGGMISIGLAVATGSIWPLLVTLCFFVSSLVLGKAILSAVSLRPENAGWFLNFLAGAGIYGTAAGLLAYFPYNYPGIYGAALAMPLLLRRRSLHELASSLRVSVAGLSSQSRLNLLNVAIAVIALVHFVTALLP